MSKTEKITINLKVVNWGKIDMAFTRTAATLSAIRSQLEKHTLKVQRLGTRNSLGVGIIAYTRRAPKKHNKLLLYPRFK